MSSAYEALEQAIRTGDIRAGADEATRLLQAGHTPQQIFRDCIEPTLADIGDRFSRLELFLPEMMEAADVVRAVQATVGPHLAADPSLRTSKGRIVICTVSGDLHDIGKNIVRAMLEVNGFEVRDLGVDVRPAAAVDAARETGADILALSALMLPSLPYMRDAIDMVKQSEALRSRVRVLVGGGPVSREWAMAAGADGYGDDAIEAVREARSLMGHAE